MSLFDTSTPKVALRGMHLDLKGYPMTPMRLLSLPKILSEFRFNVVMVEWEDMFCWQDESLRNSCAFSVSIIREFLENCRRYEIEPIPLVQTFGHMENVLACEKYASLRESGNDYRDICPSHKKSAELVFDHIEQIMDIHAGFIKRVHLGADEVRSLGQCPTCRREMAVRGKEHFYCDFLDPIFDKVLERNLKPIIWHDMLINADDDVFERIAEKSELMLWEYQPTVFWRNHVTPELINRCKAAEATVWGSSAFKGADGVDRITPDMDKRIQNNLSWTNISEEYDLEGLMVTGWSRYTSCCIPCESLESSWMSLLVASSIMWNGNVIKCEEDYIDDMFQNDSLKPFLGKQAVNARKAARKMQELQSNINEDINYYLAMAHDSICERDRLNPQVKQEITTRLKYMINIEWPDAVSEFTRAHTARVSNEWIKAYIASQTSMIIQRMKAVNAEELYINKTIAN